MLYSSCQKHFIPQRLQQEQIITTCILVWLYITIYRISYAVMWDLILPSNGWIVLIVNIPIRGSENFHLCSKSIFVKSWWMEGSKKCHIHYILEETSLQGFLINMHVFLSILNSYFTVVIWHKFVLKKSI